MDWRSLCGNGVLQVLRLAPPPVPALQEMKELARLGATHFHHIDSAITWTFRNHLMFRERYGMK